MSMDGRDQLRKVLNSLAQGPISANHRQEVLLLLRNCWPAFDGFDETNMASHKLDRVEDLKWDPPLLSFTIERHGATVMGSSRAELQHWIVDLENGSASRGKSDRRQLYSMSPRLDVKPIVQLVINAVESGGALSDGALIRDSDDLLRIKQGILIPADGPKETIAGRRRRFKSAIVRAMKAIGWELVASNPALKFKKINPTLSTR